MLILFFDSRGVIHHKYVPEGETVNAIFPCEARYVEGSEVLFSPR